MSDTSQSSDSDRGAKSKHRSRGKGKKNKHRSRKKSRSPSRSRSRSRSHHKRKKSRKHRSRSHSRRRSRSRSASASRTPKPKKKSTTPRVIGSQTIHIGVGLKCRSLKTGHALQFYDGGKPVRNSFSEWLALKYPAYQTTCKLEELWWSTDLDLPVISAKCESSTNARTWKLFEDQHAGFATEWKNFRVVNQADQKLQVVALAKAAGMMQLSVEAFLQQRHQLQQAKLHNPHFAGVIQGKAVPVRAVVGIPHQSLAIMDSFQAPLLGALGAGGYPGRIAALPTAGIESPLAALPMPLPPPTFQAGFGMHVPMTHPLMTVAPPNYTLPALSTGSPTMPPSAPAPPTAPPPSVAPPAQTPAVAAIPVKEESSSEAEPSRKRRRGGRKAKKTPEQIEMTDLRKELKKISGEAGKLNTKVGQLQRQIDDQRALAKDWKGKFTELNAKVTKARTQKKLLTSSLQGKDKAARNRILRARRAMFMTAMTCDKRSAPSMVKSLIMVFPEALRPFTRLAEKQLIDKMNREKLKHFKSPRFMLSCAYSYARQPREAGRMGTSLGRAYLWTYESHYDVNLRKFMTKRAALRICGQIMYGSSGYDTIQKMITGYMEEAKVSFVTQEDYYNPDMDIGDKWIDVTQVPAKEKDRPFAHIANASCIDAFVKAILCEDNMEEHDLKFLEEGDIRDLVERRSAKLEAGSLGPHDRMEHTMRMYLHLDGAAAKGMPRKWGKTATSFKIRPAFMTQGCSQLNPPPPLP